MSESFETIKGLHAVHVADLISFGNYLLSELREGRVRRGAEEGFGAVRVHQDQIDVEDMIDSKLRQVSHADIENWCDQELHPK